MLFLFESATVSLKSVHMTPVYLAGGAFMGTR